MSPIAGGDICNTDCLIVGIEKNTGAASIAAKVKVVLDIHYAVDISGGGIATPASMAIDVLGPNLSAVCGIEVLNII